MEWRCEGWDQTWAFVPLVHLLWVYLLNLLRALPILAFHLILQFFQSCSYTWIHAVFAWDTLCSSNSMLSPEPGESSSEPQFLTQVSLLGLVFPCSTQILTSLRGSMSPWMWRARRFILWTVGWPLTCPTHSSWGPREVWISSSPLISQPGQVIPALLSK